MWSATWLSRIPTANTTRYGAIVIDKVIIAALGEDEDELTAPAARQVELVVISGLAHLSIREVSETGIPAEDVTASVRLPARSLLRALTALVEDDEAPLPQALTHQRQTVGPDTPGLAG